MPAKTKCHHCGDEVETHPDADRESNDRGVMCEKCVGPAVPNKSIGAAPRNVVIKPKPFFPL